MRKFSRSMERSSLSELNITPLLDLAFVLLIIFMITAPLMESRIEVDLPEADDEGAAVADAGAVKEVAVDGRGIVFFEGVEVNVERLRVMLRALKRQDAKAAVALRADKNLRYQQLVDVLDAIRDSGVGMGLSTSVEEGKGR